MRTDLELITEIKKSPTNDTVLELVNRHTGIYVCIIDRYAHINPNVINRQDLIDQKLANIYTYALDYKLDSKMKFETYVGQRIKWECKTLLRRSPTQEDIEKQIIDIEMTGDSNDNEIMDEETHELAEELLKIAREYKDQKFVDIINLRFFSTPKILSWRKVAEKMGMCHEGVRKIFIHKLMEIKNKMIKEKYV